MNKTAQTTRESRREKGPSTGQTRYARDPDVQLMLRVKNGDEDAFAELVTKYQDRLINIFFHLLRDRELAEDLAQDVFLRVYRAKNGYEPTAKFSTWVFRIAHNLASNSRRSRSRRKEVRFAANVQDTGQVPQPGENMAVEKSGLMPNRQVDRRELRSVVQEAMDGLNERQKVAVLLHKFEEMSYADIGETMELTSTAVKSLLSRARENLRVRLETYMRTGERPRKSEPQ